jgi:hypothetical protein
MTVHFTRTAVSESQARNNAVRTILQFFSEESGQEKGKPVRRNRRGARLKEWRFSNLPEAGPSRILARKPRTVFDVAGRVFFYEFSSILNDGNELRVRAASNKLLGAPVLSIEVGPQLDVAMLIAAARKAATKQGLKPLMSPKGLVSYSFPKLGIRCKRKGGGVAVVDLNDHSVVGEKGAEAGPPATSEAAMIWSPYDRIHRASVGERNEEWQNNFEVLKQPTSEAGPAGSSGVTEQYVIPGLSLVGQETASFCAVAVAKMILDFYRIRKTQKQIALVMKTDPDGSTNPNQLKAYASLTNKKKRGSLDQTASFAEAQRESGKNRPLKSGIPGHARLVGGWKRQIRGSAVSTWLYVYDTYPVRKAKIYWENWDAVSHSNFLYVRDA